MGRERILWELFRAVDGGAGKVCSSGGIDGGITVALCGCERMCDR